MELWEDLLARGFEAIQDLREMSITESQQLEFKQKQKADRAELDSDDKKNLGQTLSAFSNATGGILIWGVVTSHRGEESVAAGFAPISNAAKFAQNLQNLIPQYLTPPNPAIDVQTILEDDLRGYVVVRVGASDFRPHMSMAKDHFTYFLRIGNATHPMVDFQVRDMLRIKTAPRLKIGYYFIHSMTTGTTRRIDVMLTVLNESDISAHHAYVLVRQSDRIRSHVAEWVRFPSNKQITNGKATKQNR